MTTPLDDSLLGENQSVQSAAGNWYQNLQVLGEGRNAATHLVVATSGRHSGLLFALKIFKRLSSQESADRFLKETAFLKTCDHPSIVRVIDDGVYRRVHPFVVEEYLPFTLRDGMRRGVSMVERLSYVLQLLSALNYLAAMNPPVAHCDLKPENIFLKGRSCVLGDFGLLQLCDGRAAASESGSFAMPREYRTPDLVDFGRARRALTPASDVFQLGLVAAELFTGQNPLVPLKDAEDKLAPIEIRNLARIPGMHGGLIASLIKPMLQVDASRRPAPSAMINRWQTPFLKAAELAKALEGRVF